MRFALVGCGEVAYSNARAIEALQDCELVAAVDVDAETARALGEQFDVRHTTSLELVLEDQRVDTVIAAVPHHLHADICVQAAAAGKHVLVEKPIATNLHDADRMIEACDRAGVALSVLFSYRYEPRIVKAGEVIEAGAIGEIVGTSIHFMTEKPASYYIEGHNRRVQTDWRGSWEKAGGGVLLMNCCHMLDYFRYLTGLEVVEVSSTYSTGNSPVEVEDTISVSMLYENGAVGSVMASSVARGERWRFDERIWGTHGTVDITPDLRAYTLRKVAGLRPARWQRLKFDPKGNRIATYLDRFAHTVRRGERPDVRGEDGRANLALILAAYESANTRKTVTLAPSTVDSEEQPDGSTSSLPPEST